MTGSNCVPAHLASSARASRVAIGRLYGRVAVIVSYASTRQTSRPAVEMASPDSPRG